MDVELYDGEVSIVVHVGVAQRACVTRFDMTRRIKLRVLHLNTAPNDAQHGGQHGAQHAQHGAQHGGQYGAQHAQQHAKHKVFKSSGVVVWYPRSFRTGMVEAGRKLTRGGLPTAELAQGLTLVDAAASSHSPVRATIKVKMAHRVCVFVWGGMENNQNNHSISCGFFWGGV